MLTSEELYERIDKLRLQKGLSVSKLNNLAGISHATLSSWKKRGTMSKLEILESLCFVLEYPLTALLYDVDLDKLTGEETELLSYWNKINEEQRDAIMKTIKSMTKN